MRAATARKIPVVPPERHRSATATATAIPSRKVKVELPYKLRFLLEMHRYKVAYGGRGSLKSWSFARALLSLGAAQKLHILCAREIQNSIKDSVHKLLSDQIEALGLGNFYQVLDNEIRGDNGTTFIFAGLHGKSVESLKSFEGIDIVWIEEGQGVSKRSWEILIPTIRAENSEIWVTFNPDMDSDETYKRFVVRPPTGAMVVRMTFEDAKECDWFPKVLEQERLDCLRDDPAGYRNIWGGECRTSVVGAVYGREVGAMIEDGRYRPTPYDPRFPVHTIWDLGWNDAMAIIMVQKTSPNSLNAINYIEDSFRMYSEYVADLNRLPYLWGTDWLPHDGENKNPQTGMSAKQTLLKLGRRSVKVIGRGDPDEQVRMARMMFPRVYMDSSERERDTGYFGCARLFDCLKHIRRSIPTTTGEPAGVVHDQYSHGGDAWRGLATIVDQIKNDGDRVPPPFVPRFRSSVRGAGQLG